MPGALLQLVAIGAQNELVHGSPSMTHFRAVYRRHTNFAMESIRMTFTSSNLEFSPTTTRTISCRIDRYAQLLHDTYLFVTLPDIWSPLTYLGYNILPPAGYDQRSTALGYEFKWIDNIGYNLIDHVEVTANGVVLQRLTGEWLKFYSYLTHDPNKRAIVDQMVGNIPELKDPANAYGRLGQYPHAVASLNQPGGIPNTKVPEPTIRSRQLIIPLHFWFAENPGMALPLVSMQNSDVYINVTFRPLNQLYTVIDVTPASATYGQRIRSNDGIGRFLSPPLVTGSLSNPALTTFYPDPYLEGNFIYLTEMEMAQLATADQTFLVKTVNFVNNPGQYGGNSDIEIPFFNLVTRIVWSTQRSDKILINDWDNYTNWDKPNVAPFTSAGTTNDAFSSITNSSETQTFMYSSGQQQITSVYPRDPIVSGQLLLDGKERFSTKPNGYFSLLQMYKHTTGDSPVIPGVYMYSFALNNDLYQPSGAINGSMFNKVILRLGLQQPLPTAQGVASQSTVCVLKSTVFSPNPVVVTAAQLLLTDPKTGLLLYPPDTIVSVVRNTNGDSVIFAYTYNLGVYVESINFLRIVSGLANFVFAN
jgi:Major capsid protein N-terminus/Large eukaryotic DNA virus major capsid protein